MIHHGLLEFEKMPFGLCNTPATFQHLMETVLAGLVENYAMCRYLNDILIVGKPFVTVSAKAILKGTFGISRNTILKHWSHCSSLVPCFGHARFTV